MKERLREFSRRRQEKEHLDVLNFYLKQRDLDLFQKQNQPLTPSPQK